MDSSPRSPQQHPRPLAEPLPPFELPALAEEQSWDAQEERSDSLASAESAVDQQQFDSAHTQSAHSDSASAVDELQQFKLAYDNIAAEKDMLVLQFSRQLAERDFAQAQVQQELDDLKLQLHRVNSSTTLDEDEFELLHSQLALVKNERGVVVQQRDLFATELTDLLAKYDHQCAISADRELELSRVHSKLAQASSAITTLQGQISSLANERDNSELRLLKKQVEEMCMRLERSESQNVSHVQHIVQQQQTVAREATARKEKISAIAAAVTATATAASTLIEANNAAAAAAAVNLAASKEKASRKRKEREAELEAEREAAAAATVAADKERKRLDKEARKAEKLREEEKAAKAAAAADKKAAASVEAKANPSKKAKRVKSAEAEAAMDLDDEAWGKELDGNVAAIGNRWNVKLTSAAASKLTPPLPLAKPHKSALSNSLDSLSLSPIHQSNAASSLSAQLAASEAALDAAREASLNDSTGSIDSVTGERRRKLFPSKRGAKKDRVTWDAMQSPEPVVIRFDEKPAAAPRAALQPLSTNPQPSTHALAHPPQKAAFVPQFSRPLTVMPAAPPAATTRGLFMHFLGGMKIPKIKQLAV